MLTPPKNVFPSPFTIWLLFVVFGQLQNVTQMRKYTEQQKKKLNRKKKLNNKQTKQNETLHVSKSHQVQPK